MKAILRPFINKQVRAFNKHTEAVPVEITSDWVHKLRLILKRQRTAFHLMEWLSPDEINSKKLWKPYKDLHERSGSFRDLCVLEEFFIRKQESFPLSTPFILNYLNEQKEIHHHRVFEALKTFESPDKKALKKAYKSLDEHKKNKIVMELINQYSHEIISTVSRALITKYVSDETYHEIRRLLKMLYYTLRFIRKEDYKDRLLIHPKWCVPITEILGDWHDLVNVGLLLEQCVMEKGEYLTADIKAEFQTYHDELYLEKEHHLKAFHRGFENLITEIEEHL